MAMIDLRSTDSSDSGGYGDPLAVISGALTEVAGETRDGWSGAGVSSRVRELVDVNVRVEIETVRGLAGWDAAALYGDEGYLTAQAWLVREGGMARGAALRLLDVARLCHRHDLIAQQFYAGQLSMAKASALARFDTDERREIFQRDLALLLDLIAGFNNDQAVKVINYWSRLADNELGANPSDSHQRQHLHASTTFQGLVAVDGLLDPETGALLLAALEALDSPDPVDGEVAPRTAAQRRADNLAEMARRSLASDGHLDPDKTVNVVVDAELLWGDHTDVDCDDTCDEGCTGHAPRPRTAGEVVGKRCEIEGQPIDPQTVARFMCGAWIARVVIDAHGVVLDLGRRKRLFNAAQRRAISIRDGGRCVFPGCSCQPSWCDVHHLNPWENGGSTDLANGALVCRRHHHLLHEGGWKLEHNADGTWTAIPPR